MSRNTSLKSNGKLAPFVLHQLQPVENKRKPCAFVNMAVTVPLRRRILDIALDVIAEADVQGREISISREVSRRLRIPVDVVNRTLLDWLIRYRSEAAALRSGVPLEAIC